MVPFIQHYQHGSASPDWLRACRAIESEPQFAPPSAPVVPAVPLPLQEAA